VADDERKGMTITIKEGDKTRTFEVSQTVMISAINRIYEFSHKLLLFGPSGTACAVDYDNPDDRTGMLFHYLSSSCFRVDEVEASDSAFTFYL
jgi:hypothetical protein